MVFSRAFLIFNGFWLAAYGLYCLINPVALQDFASITANNAQAITEIRAMYGGLELTLGLYMLACGIKAPWVQQGLMLIAVCFLGLAGARALGLYIDNDDSIYNYSAVIHESITALVAVLLLQRLTKTATQK